MSGRGRCVDVRIAHTVAYLLQCPLSSVPDRRRQVAQLQLTPARCMSAPPPHHDSNDNGGGRGQRAGTGAPFNAPLEGGANNNVQ
jgi:hypothetical protein